MRKALFVMAMVLGAGSGAAGQMVMDGRFEDWVAVEGIGDATGPEGSVDLLEMKAAHKKNGGPSPPFLSLANRNSTAPAQP